MTGFPPFASAASLHMVIDMQRLFDEPTVWHTPMLRRILPNVLRLTEAFAGRNRFARFVVPDRAEAALGQWQHYHRHWNMLVGEVLDPALIDLVAELQPHASPDTLIDKPGYSPLKLSGMADGLWQKGVRHLVFSGVETDVCVLAAVMDAMDFGFAATVVTDATGSSDEAAHQAMLALIYPRCPQQIRLLTTDQVLAEMV